MYPRSSGQVQLEFNLNLTMVFDVEVDRYFVGTLGLKLYTTDALLRLAGAPSVQHQYENLFKNFFNLFPRGDQMNSAWC